MKEATEYYTKIKVDREIQEKKFEAEIAVSIQRELAGCIDQEIVSYIVVGE